MVLGLTGAGRRAARPREIVKYFFLLICCLFVSYLIAIYFLFADMYICYLTVSYLLYVDQYLFVS